MMKDAEELRILIRAIEDAVPCPIHKNEKMEVCMECGSVRCMGCRARGCQCSNDE